MSINQISCDCAIVQVTCSTFYLLLLLTLKLLYIYIYIYICVCGAKEFVIPAHFTLGPKARVKERRCRGLATKV